MKKRLGRELWWMILPVLLLGGGAWWLGNGGNLPRLWAPRSAAGPLRIEYTPFERADVAPFDAWQGYDWTTKTNISEQGSWTAPLNWKVTGGALYSAPQTSIVFRQGETWKAVPRAPNERLAADITRYLIHTDITTMEMKVRLDKVPRDASEIRLRGWFERTILGVTQLVIDLGV